MEYPIINKQCCAFEGRNKIYRMAVFNDDIENIIVKRRDSNIGFKLVIDTWLQKLEFLKFCESWVFEWPCNVRVWAIKKHA